MMDALFWAYMNEFQILKILSLVFKIWILRKNWWCLDPPFFMNLASFIAHRVTRNWQKLGINSFLFLRLAKLTQETRQKLRSHPVFKNQVLIKSGGI